MDTPVPLDTAARQLGVGPRKLRAALRERGVLTSANLPRTALIETGYFRVEERRHVIESTAGNVPRWYAVTLVTGAGMALLSEIADSMRQQQGASRVH